MFIDDEKNLVFMWDYWHDENKCKFYLILQLMNRNTGKNELIFIERTIL